MESDYLFSKKEREALAQRIAKLKDLQIASLFSGAGIRFDFSKEEMLKELVPEVKKNKVNSTYLEILMREADSKEDMIRIVEGFEKENAKKEVILR